MLAGFQVPSDLAEELRSIFGEGASSVFPHCPACKIVLRANEGEAIGDRQELVTGLDLLRAETVDEALFEGWHEGRAAGQEHLVDLACLQSRLFQCRRYGCVDLLQVRSDPAFEFLALDRRLDPDAFTVEAKPRALFVR